MPIEHGTTYIDAPVEVVFDELADPANLYTMLRPNLLTEITDLEPMPEGGYRYKWSYRLMGKTVRAESETVDYARPERFAARSTGGMETISRWKLEPQGRGTLAAFSIEYGMDNSILSWLTARFASNQVRYSIEIALMALKSVVMQKHAHADTLQPLAPPSMQTVSQQDTSGAQTIF